MRERTIEYLVCPRRLEADGKRCGGGVAVVEDGLPIVRAGGAAADEILEGIARCALCEEEYPIISGVLILIDGVNRYLTRFWRAVISSAALHGTVSVDLTGWIEKRRPDAPGLPSADQHFDVNIPGSMDRLSDLVGGDPRYGTFAKFLKEWQGRSPYDRLAAFSQNLGMSGGLAVDSGCGAGAMALRLAAAADYVIGVDHAFGAILLARRLLLHQPRPRSDYELRLSAEAFALRSAAPGIAASAGRAGGTTLPLANADFLVADSTDLPMEDGSVDTVAEANILEIQSLREALRESARVLRAGGIVLFTDPFKMSPEGFSIEAADPVEKLKRFLGDLGLSVQAEEDFVPWVWYLYDRHFQVYLNYCAAARKS